MKISLAFLLFFVAISTQQRLQRWNYWAPQYHYQESFPSLNNPYNYYPISNDENFQSRPYFISEESRPSALNGEYRIANGIHSQPIGEFRKLPFFKRPPVSSNSINTEDDAKKRFFFNLFNNNNNNNNNGAFSNLLSNFPSILNPFAYGFTSSLPVIVNPNRPDLLNSGTCTGTGGESGLCLPSGTCNLLGRTASGSCGLGGSLTSCCINVVNKCDQTITNNNTYWRPPTDLTSVRNCSLTVRLSDSVQAEKRRPICQIRLDFIGFTTAQPNNDSVCATDSFTATVPGSDTNPGPICGDNDGQHMYLPVTSSAIQATDLKLLFSLTSDATVRKSWNIKIALLPCGVNYLAPENCLQYFTEGTGQIKSFNWKDNPALLDPTMTAPTRHLANQTQLACIRVQSANTKRNCYTACSDSSFIVSTSSADGEDQLNRNQVSIADCNNDFVVIPGGSDPAIPYSGATQPNFADRYCGERLSFDEGNAPGAGTTNLKICSPYFIPFPFHVYFQTNGDEATLPLSDVDGRGNQGFCVNYAQE